MKTQETRTPMVTEEGDGIAAASSAQRPHSVAKDLQVSVPRRQNSHSMYSTDSVSDRNIPAEDSPVNSNPKAKNADKRAINLKAAPTSIFPLTHNPSTLTLTGSDKSAKQDNTLKSKVYFVFLINQFFIDEFIYSNSSVTLPSLVGLYVKPASFNIPDSEVNTFTLLFITVYTGGLFIGGVLAPFIVAKIKPSYSRLLFRLIMLAALILTVIKEKNLFLAMRFVIGFSLGVLQPNDIGEAFKFAPKDKKSSVGTYDAFYFSVGCTLGTLGSYLANSDQITWQSLHLFLAALLALTMVLSVFYVGIDHSYSQDLRKNDEKAAVAKLSRAFQDHVVQEMVKEEKDFIALSKKADSLWYTFLANKKEFYYAVVVILVGNLGFVVNYSSYLMLFLADDLNNSSETQAGALFITIGSAVELLLKGFLIVFPGFARRRKLSYGIALALYSLIWFVHMILYLSDRWVGVRPMVVIWFFVAGAFFFPAFWSQLSDVISGELMGVVLSISRLVDIASQNYFSFTFPKGGDRSTYWIACMIFGITSAIGALIIWLYFFETSGKTKVEIHQHLNRQKHQVSNSDGGQQNVLTTLPALDANEEMALSSPTKTDINR